MTVTDYTDFLRAKAPVPEQAGRPIAAADVHPILKDHQRAIVEWAVAGGRCRSPRCVCDGGAA